MRKYLWVNVLFLCLLGCTEIPSHVDEKFGMAVRQTIASQIVNPKPTSDDKTPALTDGQSAKAAVDRYQKSFEVLLPTSNSMGNGNGANGGNR